MGNYQSKDAKQTKTFDALEWLAAMCSHGPNRGEQMVRYYGYYSNVSRENGKKKSRMLLYPTSLKRPVFHRKKERPGHD
ncbi:MAG: transposase [Deltaproteobacteria bacterium]|nr:transposase [Deltaproteobacteria bacterium]